MMSEIDKLSLEITNCQEEVQKSKQMSSQYEEEKSLLEEKLADFEKVLSNGRLEYDNVCKEKADLTHQVETIKEQMVQIKEELDNENSQLKGQVVDLDNQWSSKVENVQKDLEVAKLRTVEISKENEVINENSQLK